MADQLNQNITDEPETFIFWFWHEDEKKTKMKLSSWKYEINWTILCWLILVSPWNEEKEFYICWIIEHKCYIAKQH